MSERKYSAKCGQYVYKCIEENYLENPEEIFKSVNAEYETMVAKLPDEWCFDKNFHNKQGGTYDCIMLFALYKMCRDKVTVKKIEEINNELFLPSFRKLSFINYNHKFLKPLMHKIFKSSQKRCEEFHDFEMHVADYDKTKPLYYDFTFCPIADFAKRHDLIEVMPAICNGDYYAMELIGAKLIRKCTCATDDYCDYTIVGSKDPSLKDHEEYIDDMGFIRNR